MKSNISNRSDYYKQNRLTKEELKKHKGFENMSDEELERKLSCILQLAAVLVEIQLDLEKNEQGTD